MRSTMLTGFFLLAVHIAFAQYGDAYHAPDNYLINKNAAAYAQSVRDRATSSTNTKYYGNQFSQFDALMKEQAAEKRRKFEAAEKAAALALQKKKAAAEEKDPVKAAAKAESEAQVAKDRELDLKAYRAQIGLEASWAANFRYAGINSLDAAYMAEWLMPREDKVGGDFTAAARMVIDLIPVAKLFTENYPTMSYEDLAANFDIFYFYAPYTTIKIATEVEARFPDKQAELDNYKINAIAKLLSTEFVKITDEISMLNYRLSQKYPGAGYYMMQAGRRKNYKGFYESRKYEVQIEKDFDTAALSVDGIMKLMAANRNLTFQHIAVRYNDRFTTAEYKYDYLFGKNYLYEKPTFPGTGIPEDIRCSSDIVNEFAQRGDEAAMYMYSTMAFFAKDTIENYNIRKNLFAMATSGVHDTLVALRLMFMSGYWSRQTFGNNYLAKMMEENVNWFNTLYPRLSDNIRGQMFRFLRQFWYNTNFEFPSNALYKLSDLKEKLDPHNGL